MGVAWLRDLMAAAVTAGEPSHTYGVLIGAQLDSRWPSIRAGERAVQDALAGADAD